MVFLIFLSELLRFSYDEFAGWETCVLLFADLFFRYYIRSW